MGSWARLARVQLLLAQLLAQFRALTRAQVARRRKLGRCKSWHGRRLALRRPLVPGGPAQFAAQLLTFKLAISPCGPARARLRVGHGG